ncbi:MAG: hypothetical protein CFH18_00717 [Alphaproteobacteria bacterium MarineAlpha5_Bin8]|nr:MAG: hypothetical protein CFH17_00334 [Alphaproteobacteria bacterium MarineAlpha5_Bin7]PPR46118.1 MAG: hypothetical protein CFH18_00717 [Alphaproteobacteria bacterium MarineAlpha5_Bin8]PPR53153.1 MAG: hypothetical protein CFH16_01150 [Alphaproteobacteria bacterium MarineAlpha5_Bin6]|tara:strand:- start:108 stop:542 length:435 start_codon:yes stop_codon:yes gene_type:complete
MIFLYKFLLLIFLISIIPNCSEKITYSGKILNTGDFNTKNLNYKEEVLTFIGQPDFIDPIENKYYYFSEQKQVKNFFNQKIIDRKMIVFNFDENQTIISIAKYDLNDEKDIEFIKEKTPNNILQKGLIEKIFGGVGNNIPTTTE